MPSKPRVAVALSTAFLALLTSNLRAEEPEIAKLKSSFRILHDGAGHYIAVAKEGANVYYYYGNGKRFHRMRGHNIGVQDKHGGSVRISDPRVRNAELRWGKRGGSAMCARRLGNKANEKVSLQLVSRKETAAMTKRAKFLPPVKRRKAHVLARDAFGIYFFVDRIDERDYRGFRMFVGEAGRMKKVALKNVATDTAGQVFATKKGALQVRPIRGGLEGYAWVQPNRKDTHALVNVPVGSNEGLIFNRLGVYESIRLGTFCDDI